MNSAILREEEFIDNFGLFWEHLVSLKTEYQDVACWWDDLVKPSLKEFCITYSKHRASRRRGTLKFWFAYLKVCLNKKNWSEVTRAKQEIEHIMYEGALGSQIRSRSTDLASDETASLYSSNKEFSNAKRNSIEKLKVNDVITVDPEQIEQEVVSFFNALFNGHHDANLSDTGSPFVPNFSNVDSKTSV